MLFSSHVVVLIVLSVIVCFEIRAGKLVVAGDKAV